MQCCQWVVYAVNLGSSLTFGFVTVPPPRSRSCRTVNVQRSPRRKDCLLRNNRGWNSHARRCVENRLSNSFQRINSRHWCDFCDGIGGRNAQNWTVQHWGKRSQSLYRWHDDLVRINRANGRVRENLQERNQLSDWICAWGCIDASSWVPRYHGSKRNAQLRFRCGFYSAWRRYGDPLHVDCWWMCFRVSWAPLATSLNSVKWKWTALDEPLNKVYFFSAIYILSGMLRFNLMF